MEGRSSTGSYICYLLAQQGLDQLRPGCDVGEDPGPQGAPQGFLTGVGGADAHDMRALLQQLQRDLDGEVLIRLDHRACLVEVVDQQPSTGVLLLEQAAVPDQGGKVGAGGVVSDVASPPGTMK